MIGDKVAIFESGTRGTSAISNGAGDPGGVSYGKYQLSTNTGTLQDFLDNTVYKSSFIGLTPGTHDFNVKWEDMATDPGFQKAEHDYIERTHYKPVMAYAVTLGVDEYEPSYQEAIWSMSVQHGKAKQIVGNAVDMVIDHYHPIDLVNAFYDARTEYVKGIHLPPGTLQSLLNRYVSERKVVIGMIQ